jgi:DNA-binding winged helix-turn-helix (wHTH) protein
MTSVRLRLGDLTFDPDARQLLRDREEIHLSPKAFELLKTLVDQRPRALSKNELHKHLWPATFVSETNLASLIAEIREALGDSARQPRFIRTAYRFGYAFSGQAVEDAVAHASANPTVGHGDNPSGGPAGFCWLIMDGKRLPLSPGENILGRESDGGGIRILGQRDSRGSQQQERHLFEGHAGVGCSRPQQRRRNPPRFRRAAVSHAVTVADRFLAQPGLNTPARPSERAGDRHATGPRRPPNRSRI